MAVDKDFVAIDGENYSRLKKTISDILGFNMYYYTDSFLKRRIEVRLRFLNIDTYLAYEKMIKTNKDEHEKLLRELTIHTTNFFRDPSMYHFFTKDITKYFLANKKINKKIRVWSAGCSTGEEAYSIIICFFEGLGADLNGFDVKIIGTDYSMETVVKAREALFDETQFREMPPALVSKYFDRAGERNYSPKNFLKRYVEFNHGDIIKDQPSNMDIIFCRNTVIYFDSDTKSKLYENIYDKLSPGGLFIMGKTELLLGPSREKFKIFSADERIYVKN